MVCKEGFKEGFIKSSGNETTFGKITDSASYLFTMHGPKNKIFKNTHTQNQYHAWVDHFW